MSADYVFQYGRKSTGLRRSADADLASTHNGCQTDADMQGAVPCTGLPTFPFSPNRSERILPLDPLPDAPIVLQTNTLKPE